MIGKRKISRFATFFVMIAIAYAHKVSSGPFPPDIKAEAFGYRLSDCHAADFRVLGGPEC
jgi:hypothetical protein